MAMTEFPLGDSLAVQRWSLSLAVEAAKKSYMTRFMKRSKDAPIMVMDELSNKAGEKITYALRHKLADAGIEGDNILEGTSGEEALDFYSAYLYIDQLRKGTKSKGMMSEQRVPYNLRAQGRDALATWWAEVYDEQAFMYLSGARGVDTSFKVGLSWTGRASNSFADPDSNHLVYGGNASSKTDLTSTDRMSVDVLERVMITAETVDPMIQPLMYQGERKFILVIHPYQKYDLRTSLSEKDWFMTHRQTDGPNSPIYTGALGEWNGIIIHCHRNVIRFDDYGSGGDLDAARALFLGAQAGVIAWANNGGPRKYKWHEERDDRGNALAISAGAIFGIQKTTFNSADYGVIAVDTYATQP